jgi:EAL and modified HD-GYP domain-containing signal transduction protein
VKVDIRPLSRAERASIALHIRRLPNSVKLIAEKVETREQYEEALELDYDYFQGYLLDRPMMHSGREIPASRLALTELQHAVQRPDFDFGEVETIVKRDIALSFKMLRFANVAAHGVTQQIESVRHALVMLGQEDVLRTVSLLALADQGVDKPQELAVRSVIRASVCESLALEMDLADERLDHFLVGMFSMIDVILDLPMADLVSHLPTSPQVDFALLGSPGPLREVLDLLIAYEDADWPRAQILMRRLGVGQNTLRSLYLEAAAKTDDGFAKAA